MAIEFKVGPKPVNPQYRQRMAQEIASAFVPASGYFDEYGVFGLTPRGSGGGSYEPSYWALNLLKFTYAENGVWSRGDGTMTVFGKRMEMGGRGNTAELVRKYPLHTLGPGNVRKIGFDGSYDVIVPESGWVFARDAALLQRHKGLKDEELRRILRDASQGVKPPFFDWITYTKVVPEYVGKRVHVLAFEGIDDGVVFDTETKQMIPAYHEAVLSKQKWESKSPV